MNKEEKIGMYTSDEIYEELANGFLQKSMVDAMYFKIKDLQQKLDKILTYAKKQCDDYLKEDDCEYCDGVFASCRKVLQLAGEDISEYK
jgi:hypothetical protein